MSYPIYIRSFDEDYDFLSNFYIHEITYRDVVYKSSEHAYQAAKTISTKDHDYITESDTPGIAKTRGKKVLQKPNWEKIKYQIMEDILDIKFNDKNLKVKLIKTKPKVLVEGNRWHDNTWGDCECRGCKNTYGKNMLGKLLMEKRKKLINITPLF